MTKGAGSPANMRVFFSRMPLMTMAATPMKYAEVATQPALWNSAPAIRPMMGILAAAGNEGGGHDGHFAVTVVLDGTGGHDARARRSPCR